MGGPAEDAKAHYAAAQKALKPSYMSLKFSADHLTASMEYASAAAKFRAAGMLPEAVDAWVRSAKAKEDQHDSFGAGRAYESAGGICDGKGPGGTEAAAQHWEKAVLCFRLAGKGDIAVKLILKLAQAYEARGDIPKTKEAFKDAIEVYENDEKDYNLGDVYKLFIGYLVRQDQFDAATEAINAHVVILIRQKHFTFVHKELLAKAVLCLRMQDTVRAEQALAPDGETIQGWFMSQECQAGMELVAAFQAFDAEAAERILKEQVFTFLQVEIARVARTLRVHTLGAPAKAAAQEPTKESPARAEAAAVPKTAAAQESTAPAASTEAPAAAPAAGYAQEPPPAAPTAGGNAQDLAELLM